MTPLPTTPDPAPQAPGAATPPAGDSALVPILQLEEDDREALREHLLRLDAGDRYLRFGYAATDEQVGRYVDALDFRRDDLFGIFNRGLRLIALAHLAAGSALECGACAEFGVSVDPASRGRGYGTLLFERAVRHARNEGVELLFIHALSENAAMLHIARRAGATLEPAGSETEAYLRLPPATLDSRMAELVEQQVAETDFLLKRQARQFRRFLATVQEVRQGVREARAHCAP
ncbi:MAG: hypothetical protein RL014_1610 [Pseudomonadota bacterium]|jgi:GNAT superfamily N-acetyltransferase